MVKSEDRQDALDAHAAFTNPRNKKAIPWPKVKSDVLYNQISEKIFTAQIIRMAQMFGWRVAHFRPAMTKRGRWVTAVAGDGAGFPDLVLIKAGKPIILAELKAEKGRVTPAQQAWLESAKRANPAALGCVWRPGDIETIERILRG